MRITSKKEKRLWISTIIVLAGIYSTVGIVQPVSDILQSRGLLSPLFFLGMLLVGVIIIIYGINNSPDKSVIGISLAIVTVYLMVFVRTEIPQERTHLIEYGVVAALIYQALLERTRQGYKVPYPAILAILITGIAGGIDEGIQKIIPNRVFDFRDILFNFLAGILSVGSIVLLNWISNRPKKKNH